MRDQVSGIACEVYCSSSVCYAFTASVFGKVVAWLTSCTGYVRTQTKAVVWNLVPLSTNLLVAWSNFTHAVSVAVENQSSWACLQDTGLSNWSLSCQLAPSTVSIRINSITFVRNTVSIFLIGSALTVEVHGRRNTDSSVWDVIEDNTGSAVSVEGIESVATVVNILTWTTWEVLSWSTAMSLESVCDVKISTLLTGGMVAGF